MQTSQDSSWVAQYNAQRARQAAHVAHMRTQPSRNVVATIGPDDYLYAVKTLGRRSTTLAVVPMLELDFEAYESLLTEDDNGETSLRLDELNGWKDVVLSWGSKGVTGETRVYLERIDV